MMEDDDVLDRPTDPATGGRLRLEEARRDQKYKTVRRAATS